MFPDRCHCGCDDPRTRLGKDRTVAQSIASCAGLNALKRVIY